MGCCSSCDAEDHVLIRPLLHEDDDTSEVTVHTEAPGKALLEKSSILIDNESASSSSHQIAGVMGKLGGFFGNSIQDRYFILKGHLLAYYKNKEESELNQGQNAKGALECRCVDTINHDSPRYKGQNRENMNLRFTLRGPLLKREYVLEAKSPSDRAKWIDAIRYARIRHDISRSELNLVNITDNSAVFFADATKLAKLQAMDSAISLFAFNDAMKTNDTQEVTRISKEAAEAALKAVGNDQNNVRVVDANGNSILHLVCANNRYPLELVKELVEVGAMLHARDFFGRTLLHVALINGRDPVFIEGLLKLGMSPLVTDSDNMNAFHLLAKQNHTALVEPVLRLLVQVTNIGIVPARAGATGLPAEEFADFINSVGGYAARDRGSVLFFAAGNRYMTDKELQLFMTYGADPTWTRQNDPVVIQEAEKMTQEEFQSDLLLNASVLSERPDMKIILQKCLEANHTPGAMWYNRIVESSGSGSNGDQKVLDSIDVVLKSKQQRNEQIDDNSKREDLSKIAACCNFDTLKTAVLRDSLIIFDRLVELGADPSKISPSGDSLQHIACRALNQKAVDRLLELGIGLDSGKKESNTAVRSRSVMNTSKLEKLELLYPIDMVFLSEAAFAKDPSGICPFMNHLLLRGSPATPNTLAHAITTKRHDIEVFSKISSRVLEFANRPTLAQVAPRIMYSLVFNGGVERPSQDSHLREKFGPMIDTIVDVCADLCKKGAKLDGVDESGDSRLHGIIIRSARIKPHNVAGIVGLFIETAGPEILFLKDSKNQTVLELVKERQGRLDMVMRVINQLVPAETLEDLQKRVENGEEIKVDSAALVDDDLPTPIVVRTISKIECRLLRIGHCTVQVPTHLLVRHSHYEQQLQLQQLNRDAEEARNRICLEESDARNQVSSFREKSYNFVSYPAGSAENLSEATIKKTCVKLRASTDRLKSRHSCVVASAENLTSHMWFLMIVTVKKSDADATRYLDSLSYCCKRHVDGEKKIVYEMILPPKTVLKINLGRRETKRVSDIIRFKRVRNRAQTERGEIVMEAEAAF